MQTMNSNKKSLNTETSNTGDRPMSQKVRQIFDEIESMASEGSSIEEVVYTIMSSGQVDQSEMSNALEHLGYTPDAIVDLFQKVEILEREMLAQQQSQQQQPQQQPQQSEDVSAQELDAMAEQAAQQLLQGEQQPQMQFGGVTNKGTGLLSQYDPVPHPVYLPPLPRRGNLLGAAYLLDDALGTFFNNKDRDGDGLMDGTFRDWSAKNARYKNKQLQNRSYEVDYGDLNPDDYAPTWADLAEGKVRTKDQLEEDLIKYSRLDFDPSSNQYFGAIASREDELDMLSKKERNRLGNSIALSQFMEGIDNYEDTDRQMMVNAMRTYEPGTGLGSNRTSYTEEGRTPEEIKKLREDYRSLMLGQKPMQNEEFVFNFNQEQDFNTPTQRSIVQVPTEQLSTETPSREQQFKDWALQNPAVRMTTAGRQEFDRLNPMRYGGDLPKAQFGPPYDWMQGFDPNNPMGLPDFSQMGQTSYINPDTGMPWVPGPQASSAPSENDRPQEELVEIKSKALKPIPIEMPEMNLAPINLTVPTAPETVAQQPTVTRKRSLGNAFNQIETFIKDNPAMRAYGDVSQAAVMGANLANEWFAEKEYRDYKNKLRNSTTADKIYTAKANPLNKRGTFDVNLGLAEPDNLVDYYAQAMYGKEMYKKGGEFVPHMMYDPVSGEAYEAKVEADHNRFAKMGFVHQDEMQTGGEVEVDNDTLAALIAAGADIEML